MTTGSLEHKLQVLILDIAEAVQNKMNLPTTTIQRINSAFREYQAIQLRVSLISTPVESSEEQVKLSHEQQESRQQILLHTVFVDEADQLRRIYMEALISLLEALEKSRLELQRCIQCNQWFIPYQRAQVTKFCSSKCRNRYNYVKNKQKSTIANREEILK